MTITPIHIVADKLGENIAAKQPYTRLTLWYAPSEHHLLERAVAQLGNISHLVVKGDHGTAIYRSTYGMRSDHK